VSTRRSRRRHGRGRFIDRLWVPGIKAIEAGARDEYELGPVSSDLLNERYSWSARVPVPGYDVVHLLRIELEEFKASVTVEDWTGPTLKHTFGGNELCMWYPSDPDGRKWSNEDGLLKLLDTAAQHLFKEYHYRETGQWPGEEAPHGAPKAVDRQTVAEVA
jgi:hypothetical protein